jgi:hypothetical protein
MPTGTVALNNYGSFNKGVLGEVERNEITILDTCHLCSVVACIVELMSFDDSM